MGIKIGLFQSSTAIELARDIGSTLSTQVAAPFLFFTRNMSNGVFGLLMDTEVQRHPASGENTLRESAITMPGIGPAWTRTRLESSTTFNTNNPAKPIRDELRSRGTAQISFVLLIWLTSIIIVFDPDIRTLLLPRLLEFGYAPDFLIELWKRTRTGICGKIRVAVGLAYNTTFSALVLAYPAFKDSVFDPDHLRTTTGQVQYVSILQSLRVNEHNYIPFTKVTKDNLPPLESGTTITFTSLTVTITEQFFANGKVSILPASSYPNHEVPATHFTDCFLFHCIHLGTTVITSVNPLAEAVYLQTSLNTSVQYICDRVLGIEKNPSTYSKPSQSDSSSDGTSSDRRGSGRGQRRQFESDLKGQESKTDFQPSQPKTGSQPSAILNIGSMLNYLAKPKHKRVLRTLLRLLNSNTSLGTQLQAKLA